MQSSLAPSGIPPQSDQLWRAAFESAAVGMAIADPTGRFVATNKAYQDIVGFSGEALNAMTLHDLTFEDDRLSTRERADRLVCGGQPEIHVEKRYRRKDGSVIWVRINASAITTDDGSPSLILGVVEDVTARRHAEDAVRVSEAYLADAQRISRTGSWVLNPFTGSLFWSAEMYRILGFDPANGQPDYEAVRARGHPDDVDWMHAEVWRGIEARRDIEGQYRNIMPDGSIRHIHFVGHPAVGPDGELREYIGTIADITEQKRAEERLMQAQDEERRRIARQLHETTAQDLAALKMNLASLARRGSLAGEDLSLLEDSAALATEAMEDIRVLSYLLHPPLLDEVGLAAALRWYAKGFSQRSGVEVRLALLPTSERLPPAIETALFRVIQECLINIHRHSGSATAEVRLRRADGRLVLEVQDWGRGMAPGAELRSGEGVGIAAMRERAQQLAGTLEVDSRPGGTTIRATVPLPAEEP
jgi:PAS domain S-box-containing protein